MTCGHVLVASVDGIGARELAVLLVHVVSTGARVITDPDAKVLDHEWLLLTDLNTGHRTEVSQCQRKAANAREGTEHDKSSAMLSQRLRGETLPCR